MKTKNCPKCNKTQVYKNEIIYNTAVKKNTLCGSCGKVLQQIKMNENGKPCRVCGTITRRIEGACKSCCKTRDKSCPDCGTLILRKSTRCSPCTAKVNGRKHTQHTGDMSRFTSLGFKGKKHTDTAKFDSGYKNIGRKHTKESRENMRLAAVKRIERQGFWPSYNESSIPILEQIAKELGITDLQHAENGGEKKILGYFVDGYSKEKNIVIEYYEPHHQRPKKFERDLERKNNIIEHLGCKFIEIKEWEYGR